MAEIFEGTSISGMSLANRFVRSATMEKDGKPTYWGNFCVKCRIIPFPGKGKGDRREKRTIGLG